MNKNKYFKVQIILNNSQIFLIDNFAIKFTLTLTIMKKNKYNTVLL